MLFFNISQTYSLNSVMVGAWSMGTGKRTKIVKSNSNAPGPGAYNEVNVNISKRKMPYYSMSKSPRKHIANILGESPGPGTYKIPQKVGGFKPSFGLKHTNLSKTISQTTPGPGNYFPEKFHKNSPLFSFGSKPEKKNTSLEKIPGP